LGHSILNDLLEEFGEGDDAQDATAILYAGKFTKLIRPYVKISY
jgi:hypothetical protein